MHFSVFSDAEWLYPDSAHSALSGISLHLPRGGHDGAQLLGGILSGTLSAVLRWDGGRGPAVRLYRLLPVGVNENTSPTLMTTTDYESCREFVTRKAPFEVFDALKPLTEPETPDGTRLALYLCAEAAADETPGEYSGTLTVTVGADKAELSVRCTVHAPVVPPPAQARLSMLNFFDYDGPVRQHGLVRGGADYWQAFRSYVRAQLDMRCTHILLPPGEAVYRDGAPAGFDFSFAQQAGRIALEEGAAFLCGGHVAHWHEWDDSAVLPQLGQHHRREHSAGDICSCACIFPSGPRSSVPTAGRAA